MNKATAIKFATRALESYEKEISELKNKVKELQALRDEALAVINGNVKSNATNTRYPWGKYVKKTLAETDLTREDVLIRMKELCAAKLDEIGEAKFVKSVRDYLTREAKKEENIKIKDENGKEYYSLVQ